MQHLVSCIFIVLLAFSINYLTDADRDIEDLWFKLRFYTHKEGSWLSFLSPLMPLSKASEDLVCVKIDDETALALPDILKDKPDLLATALINLERYEVSLPVMDIYFPSINAEYSTYTELFHQSFRLYKDPRVIVRASRRDDKTLLPPYPALAKLTTQAPYFFKNFEDKAVRASSLVFHSANGDDMPAMPTLIYAHQKNIPTDDILFEKDKMNFEINGKKAYIPLIDNEFMLLNYNVLPKDFQTYSFLQLYFGQIPQEALKGKTVIISHSHSMDTEDYYVPALGNVKSDYLLALTLNNLFNSDWLKPPNKYLTAFLTILLPFLLIYFYFPKTSITKTVIFSLLFVAAFLALSFIATIYLQAPIQAAMPIFSIIFSAIYAITVRYYTEASEKNKIKEAFQHYISPAVVNEILKNPSKLNLHGEEREVSIFFSDIEGFTAISEHLTPLEVVALLNEYLTEMTEIVLKHNGLLDKYEGDAIMAIFGAPIDQWDHPMKACLCALENQRAAEKLSARWKQEGKPEVKVRIGINTGMAVVGNMGSTMRFDYTVVGDAVNVAARLETANKIFNTKILVSETTALAVDSGIVSRKIGSFRLLGKNEPTTVYELLIEKDSQDAQALGKALRAKEVYEKALFCYMQREFEESKSILENYVKENTDDSLAAFLLERATGYALVPPPPDWTGLIIQVFK
ncbi:MAG: CHASE2 domain-containing protein [Candidatus Riflebacteria bacterium]|nr:CHASE2 domain-containing protein [Candidatus Riflebacteria bacterium]